MRKIIIAACMLSGLGIGHATRANEPTGRPADPGFEYCRADGGERVAKAEASVTKHNLSAGGKGFDYTAAAGTLLIRDDEGKPIAHIGYIAYTRQDPNAHAAPRPVMFAFNGGPGMSSMMLHMGLLGPKRVLIADPDAAPSPEYETVDNEFSMLDKADLVMIDPMGTGWSYAVCGKKIEEFLSVDTDADSVSRFIAQYLSDNNRWTSPKYILGESYGTIRAAAVVNYMLARNSLSFSGVVMLSMATDLQIIATGLRSNERPYPAFLPGFAAVAWYHHRVAGQPPALEPFLDEVRKFAAGPFNAALLKGNTLRDDERDAIAEQIHRYTGLSVEYIKTANLRVSEFAFAQELFRTQSAVVSRLDGRFLGLTSDPLQRGADYDPALAAIGPFYTGVLQDYLHRDLKVGTERSYRTANAWIGDHFDLRHQPVGSFYGGSGPAQALVNAGDDLAQALVQEPKLRVLVLSGYFDLGSPFTAAEYMVSHLGVPKPAADRVQIKYYKAGHMMYVQQASLQKLKRDLDQFVDTTH